jgi:hypothetical protein
MVFITSKRKYKKITYIAYVIHNNSIQIIVKTYVTDGPNLLIVLFDWF